jgi:hypothetical protein
MVCLGEVLIEVGLPGKSEETIRSALGREMELKNGGRRGHDGHVPGANRFAEKPGFSNTTSVMSLSIFHAGTE